MSSPACDPQSSNSNPQFHKNTQPSSQPTSADLATAEYTCITCSDLGVPARIIELLPGGNARVEIGSTLEEVNVELIEAAPGDRVLVHAKVAIRNLEQHP